MHNIISGAENWVIESASRHIYMCLTYKAVRHTWYSPASKSTSCTIFYKVHTFAAHRNYYQAFCMRDTCVRLAHRDVVANGNFFILFYCCLVSPFELSSLQQPYIYTHTHSVLCMTETARLKKKTTPFLLSRTRFVFTSFSVLLISLFLPRLNDKNIKLFSDYYDWHCV